MKNQQENTGAEAALLRITSGVDTSETKSLCCAAAGIIAPSSAPNEALIPLEKLRGAAVDDAMLNAQERPPAQPVMGYKPRSAAKSIEAEILSDEELPESFGSPLKNRRVPPKPQKHKSPALRGFRLNLGGKPGIRTLGTLLTFAGFQDRCIQPLCQFPLCVTGLW